MGNTCELSAEPSSQLNGLHLFPLARLGAVAKKASGLDVPVIRDTSFPNEPPADRESLTPSSGMPARGAQGETR